MANENSTSSAAGNAFTTDSAFNAYRKFLLPIEIFFEVLTFVKFHEAPNIFLVNRYLLPICQVYFHSGTVGQNKNRNVRDLTMQLTEGLLTIFVERNGTLQSVPEPEVDPPKIFNAFGRIRVRKCCQIEAMQFLNKFQSLLTGENNMIICARRFFLNTANADKSEKQINSSNSPSNLIVVDQKQSFLNWIEQKKLWLKLFDPSSVGIARCLENEPLIAQFNGNLFIEIKSEQNLCGLAEDAKLIYGWISTAQTRHLGIFHYDVQKARELACQIALLFEEAHVNKMETEKMELRILLPKDTVVPMHMQTVCNGIGDQQLATLRTFSAKSSDGYVTSAYVFYTKPMEHYYENMEELELFNRPAIYFL